MADFSMWGPGQSPIAVDQGQRLNEITMQEKQAQTEDFRAQTQQRQALAAVAQQKAKHEKDAQAAMQQIAMDATVTTLEQMATATMKAGFPVEAGKLMESFQKTSEMKAKAEEAQAKTEEQKLKTQATSMDIFARMVRGIGADPNPEGTFEAIKTKMRESGKPLPPGIENARWTLDLAKQLESQALSTKDNAELQLKALDEKGKEARRVSQERLDAARTEESRQKAVTESVRRENLKKSGAILDEKLGGGKAGKEKDVPRTPKEDVQMVADLIRNQFPDVSVDGKGRLDDPGMAATASYLAGEGQKLLRSNKALTREQALTQVFQQAVQDKVFETAGKTEPTKVMGITVPGMGGSPGVTKAKVPGTGGKPASSKEGPAPTNSKGWKLYTDAKGNKAYVGPNKEIEEVR